MVGRWQGSATRSLVMHADPLASYAYRWLGGIATIATIDRWFAVFWRHLRGLGQMFDTVICANGRLAERLRAGGLGRARTIAMGVEPGRFSPAHRSAELRAALLRSLGLDSNAVLLVGIGRLSGEKRWEMVVRAVQECARERPLGLLLAGDGPRRQRIELAAGRTMLCSCRGWMTDTKCARLIASADALVHGCESETFCLAAAEARASGISLIVPDRGAALDLLAPGAGLGFRAGNERSLRTALGHFIDRGVQLQRATAARVCRVRTIDEHFTELFAHYQGLETEPADFSVPMPEAGMMSGPMPRLALARSAIRGR